MMRNPSHYLHWPQFRFDHSPTMKLLYGIRVLKDLLHKSTLFFLPIFLFTSATEMSLPLIGMLTPLQRGVIVLGLFYGLSRVVNAVFGIAQSRLMARLKPATSLGLGFILFILVVFILLLGNHSLAAIVLASLVYGLHIQFFWVSYYTMLTKDALKKRLGEDMGLITFGTRFAETAAPALGGLLIATAGFSALLVVAALLGLVGLMITWQIDATHSFSAPSWKEFRSWMSEKKYRQLLPAYFGRYAHDAGSIIWPLYIFLIVGTVERVGYIYSLSLFIALVMVFVVGFYVDHSKSRRPFYASGGVLSLLWLLRGLIVNPITIAVADSLNHLAGSVHWIFFDSIDVKRGKGSKALSYFTYREVLISLGASLFWFLTALIFLVSSSWWVVFALSSVGVLLTLSMKEVENKV